MHMAVFVKIRLFVFVYTSLHVFANVHSLFLILLYVLVNFEAVKKKEEVMLISAS